MPVVQQRGDGEHALLVVEDRADDPLHGQADASSGDVVAAMIQDVDGASATIKVLSRKDGHQWLLPRNPDYAPIPGDEATIMGKVVTVLRAL